jgi:hypothetical protein
MKSENSFGVLLRNVNRNRLVNITLKNGTVLRGQVHGFYFEDFDTQETIAGVILETTNTKDFLSSKLRVHINEIVEVYIEIGEG